MDLITVKVIALSLLGGISLLLGFLPLKLGSFVDTSDFGGERNFWKRTITSVLLCFGGGVLLATSFVHMLPEVRESIESTGYDLGGVPAAEIFFCCGFFLIYFIEELVHCICDARVHSDDEATIHVHKTFTVHSRACEAGVSDMQLFGSQDNLTKTTSGPSSPILMKRRRTVSSPAPRLQPDYNTFSNDNTSTAATPVANGKPHQPEKTSPKSPDHTAVTVEPEKVSHDDGHSSGHSHSLVKRSSLRDFLTVLALSCHAIFEGLAIGLEKDAEAVWTLFAAVATHKYVISFCVGLELVTARTPLKVFSAYMAVFALVSPIGVGIGIGISTAAGAGGASYTFTVAILQALAGGTLIYVVVFEVLQREKSKSVSGMAQLTFVIIGFSILMCIEIFAGHDHGHDHDDHPHESTSLMPDFNDTIPAA